MADTGQTHGWYRVKNDAVWRHTRRIFLGSLLVFLINITLGFGNVITPGDIPHWQGLTHLHGGTLGWLTLSAIGFAVWLFTGKRNVSETYATRVKWLSWAAVVLGAGYVLSFGISFNLMGNAYALLPIFGTGMMLVIWATALLTLTQIRNQPILSTPHLLVAGGFLVASLGAIMGVLLGLQHAVGSLPLPDGIPAIGFHAGPMDTYAVMIAVAAVEWLVDRDDTRAWTWPGVLQVALFTLAGVLSFIPVDAMAMLAVLGRLAGSLVFFLRIGWRALLRNPLRHDESTWATFAPVWLLVFIVILLSFAFGPLGDGDDWAGVVAFHAYFIGLITNSLFGVYSGRTRNARRLHKWAEPAAFWLLNIGLVVFAATEFAMGSKHGAIVMGVGVLLGVVTMGYRLLGES
jgi:hypothetical protein